jgi:hypothetical protein
VVEEDMAAPGSCDDDDNDDASVAPPSRAAGVSIDLGQALGGGWAAGRT